MTDPVTEPGNDQVGPMAADGGPRQRVKLGAWFSPEEAEQVRARAGGPGKLAAFIRASVLEDGVPRRSRRAVPVELLTRFLQALGPLTAALRALADRPEIGRDDPALQNAMAEVGDMSFAVLQAMGRGRPWRRAGGQDAERESLSDIFARVRGEMPDRPDPPRSALPFPAGPS